jgi:hypothetical protein
MIVLVLTNFVTLDTERHIFKNVASPSDINEAETKRLRENYPSYGLDIYVIKNDTKNAFATL